MGEAVLGRKEGRWRVRVRVRLRDSGVVLN
jgi:hypothetical protein